MLVLFLEAALAHSCISAMTMVWFFITIFLLLDVPGSYFAYPAIYIQFFGVIYRHQSLE
jgi:hypothetical protein